MSADVSDDELKKILENPPELPRDIRPKKWLPKFRKVDDVIPDSVKDKENELIEKENKVMESSKELNREKHKWNRKLKKRG